MEEKRILAALSFETDWERQLLAGLIAYAREHELHWEIRAVARESDLNDRISQFQPHGLLCHPHMPLTLPVPTIPAVVYVDWKNTESRPLLLIDDYQIGVMAAEHLLAHGYTHFCFAGNITREYAKLRCDGFKWRLSREGRSVSIFNTAGFFLGLLNNRENPEISRQFIATVGQLKKPAAVFAADDFEAYTVFELCLKAKLRLPEEIGLLGVNNEELVCQSCDPMLSSIRIPYRQIGSKAAELLHRQLQGFPAPQKPILFQATEVVIRRSTSIEQVSDPLVAQALGFIRSHFQENISIEDLVAATGASRSMLERRFKQTISRTPYFEIQHQRIEHAKRLLQDTRMSIREVSTGCGFNSTNRFCQAFKEKVATTPSRYRQTCQN
jgi:LacI family transcriptional regulator